MPAAARRRRYPSDTSVAEWALLEPLLPIPACQTKTGGHPEKWPRRQIVDGMRYIVDNGAKGGLCLRTFPVGDGLRVLPAVEPGRGRHLHP